jgi:serine/threonine protein phosphatase 1
MIAVIGDIHGCYNTFLQLYNDIKNSYPDIKVYSVGDLIDRGNFSYEVVEFFKQNQIRFTAGNHDLMFYYYITHQGHPIGKPWIFNGSEPTLNSYDHNTMKMRDHFNVITKAPLFLNLKDCFISHAGISSFFRKKLKKGALNDTEKLEELLNTELESQHGVIWTRDELLNLGKLQIVGHTIYPEVTHNKTSNTLYIDTSAYAGNKLSAVIVDDNKLVEIFSVETFPEDIE